MIGEAEYIFIHLFAISTFILIELLILLFFIFLLSASWETYMQIRKQQLEMYMEQQTGSK